MKAETKDTRIFFRLTQEEKNRYMIDAGKKGMTLSQYIRYLLETAHRKGEEL